MKNSRSFDFGVEYLMQIRSAESEYIDQGYFAYNKVFFGVRVWPDHKKLDQYIDMNFRFTDKGRAEKYILQFVEMAADSSYYGIDIDEVVGAVFIGYIEQNIKTDRYGNTYVYANLIATRNLGYADL
ncbi:MAG: hypothetical protein MJ133_01860 [Lachnospiraceae bacterium]|nr:hypothetical protein [Lachnospiraceae bacterium]